MERAEEQCNGLELVGHMGRVNWHKEPRIPALSAFCVHLEKCPRQTPFTYMPHRSFKVCHMALYNTNESELAELLPLFCTSCGTN